MVKFGRRQRKAPAAPIFTDTHSMSGGEGESTGDSGSFRGFSARIIVTDGSNPCNILEPSQETALDTTLGLEDYSQGSSEGERGNELLIISSAVLESEDSMLEPDSEEDEEAAIAIEEATAAQKKPTGATGCNRVKVLIAILVLLVLAAAIAIPVTLLVTRRDSTKEIAQEKSLSGGDDLGLVPTPAPSNEGSSAETMIPQNYTDTDANVVAPQVTSSPTSSPELMATAAPSPAPTGAPSPEPTPVPSPRPTPRPSPSPTPRPSPFPTRPPTENPTSLAPTPRPTSPQFEVAIFQTAVVTPAPTPSDSVVDGGSNETTRW